MIPRHASASLLAALCVSLSGVMPAAAQDLHPSRRPSPVGIAKTFVGDTYVKVTYGRPYVRNRAVFGDPADGATYLVPFGQLWRTGANEATEITVTGPVEVAGQRLDPGTYSIFTVPGAERWEIRFHPGLGMDGTGRLGPDGSFTEAYDPELDILRVERPAGTLAEPVDQFTISFEQTPTGTDMVFAWETTEVRVPVIAVGG